MFEKVNPTHPDKIADRIAGAIVDLAYSIEPSPKVAVEVLIGHGDCNIIVESSCITDSHKDKILELVKRISKEDNINLNLKCVEQDTKLANNQLREISCGDNGIFKYVVPSVEEEFLTEVAKAIYTCFPTDGKYVITRMENEETINELYENKESTTEIKVMEEPTYPYSLTICQSNATDVEILRKVPFKLICSVYGISTERFEQLKINPLGFWTGGLNVDTGATNRKLGSDMGRSVTGGGLHGKDCSKADVSVNIFCMLLGKKYHKNVSAYCSIGDKRVNFLIGFDEKNPIPYSESYESIAKAALDYINYVGGFEKFAEWGLLRGDLK